MTGGKKKVEIVSMYDITSESDQKYVPQTPPRFWNYEYYVRYIDDENFMRVFRSEIKETALIANEEIYVLEYQEDGQLYRAYNLNKVEITAMFELYLNQDDTWKNTGDWIAVEEDDIVFNIDDGFASSLIFNHGNIGDERDDGIFVTLDNKDIFVPRHRLTDLVSFLRCVANDIESKI